MNMKFNYRHLHYFWVVAHEGGIARGADRLGMAVQTVSAQVRALERSLGQTLLQPAGRTLALTDAGHAALAIADRIFQLGEQLPAVVRDSTGSPVVRLSVGVFNGMTKLVVHTIMKPMTGAANLRLICRVNDFEQLLTDLALHRLDVVLADRPAPVRGNLKLYSHRLGGSPMAWYAPRSLHAAARHDFPRSLATMPVLMPAAHVAIRTSLDRWFERHEVRPNVIGEFEDSALLKAFGASGLGMFPAAELVEDELVARYKVRRVGRCDGVEEQYFAIGWERKVSHPLVSRLLESRH